MQTTLRERVPEEYRHLLLLMGLPLVDGVFLTFVLSSGLDSLFDAIIVGTLIFSGGALISVIISEFTNDVLLSTKRIVIVGVLISSLAAIQAAFAPTIETVISYDNFHRGAVLALIVLALKMLPHDSVERLPQPGLIIIVTIILSANPTGFSFSPVLYSEPALYGFIAGLIATVIAVITVFCRDLLITYVNHKILRYGCSIGLLAIALSLIGVFPQTVSIGVFAGSLTMAIAQ